MKRLRTRREFLEAALALPGAYVLASSTRTIWETGAESSNIRMLLRAPALAAPQEVLPATPPCPDADEPTPRQTEGPFYTPRSPQRTSLREQGIVGTPIVVAGFVLSRSCRPVARALVDFWQADDRGQYDNTGFRLRGHQFTDAAGRYYLETIVPGIYTGRTRHIHVKVQAPNRPVLTTQLYFPGEPRNQTDRIFDRRLLLDIQETSGRRVGRFDFVLEMS